MKIRCLLFISLIFIFVSCKDTDIIPETTQEQTPSATNSDKVYLSISCGNSDGIIATRADETGEDLYTEDYDVLESYVVGGKIYIFEESEDKTEANAVCVSSGDLLNPSESENKNDKIPIVKTLYYKNIELKDFDFDAGNTYYALAILNPFGIIPPAIGETFGNWAETSQTEVMCRSVKEYYGLNSDKFSHHKKLITMVNATGQANHTSGDFIPTTLVKIDKRDIKYGEFDDHTSHTEIFVQRNVAKVLLKAKDRIQGSDKYVDIGNSGVKIQINLANLILDVINKETYPVQKIGGLKIDGLEMEGLENIWSMNEEKKRFHSFDKTYDQIYWAIDPNYYDPKKSKEDFSSSGKDGVPPYLPPNNGVGSPLYCLENTFNTDCMLQGQTTRAIIRCSLQWWGDDETERNTALSLPSEDYLYDDNNKIPNKSITVTENNKQVTKSPKQQVTGNDFDENGFFTIGTGKNKTLWDFKHIKKKVEETAKTWGYKPENLAVSFNAETKGNAKGGYFPLKKIIELKIDLTDDLWQKLAESLGLKDATSDPIAYYYNCWSYYVVRIRHFSDEEGADWDGSIKPKPGVDGAMIAQYEAKHLGRYGVLRNNEYTITVNSIHNLGSPEQFPSITDDDTDDMPDEHYIDVSINIKSWGKRQQSFTF